MSRYKILPVPNEYTKSFIDLFGQEHCDSLGKIGPIFNRHGLYLDREKDICWVESDAGSWILGDKEEFQSRLENQARDQLILHDDVIEAFSVLESHNLLPKKLQEIWWKHRHAVMLRNTYRNARKLRISIIGK